MDDIKLLKREDGVATAARGEALADLRDGKLDALLPATKPAGYGVSEEFMKAVSPERIGPIPFIMSF